MLLLFLDAYLNLILFDLYLSRADFAALYARVRGYRLRSRATTPNRLERICAAVNLACVWYPKEVLCLQRSAATACLLKKYSVAAELVIGAQQMPFKAHAWVEVDGQVVNDKPYLRAFYGVLDRC
jgi:Transglutaminase-like superfamily